MIPRYLYRGVSRTRYEKTRGLLIPKLYVSPVHVKCDDGTTSVVDPRHGLATTPHQARAEFYALGCALGCGPRRSGVVFVIDRTKFLEYGVSAYSLCDSAVFSWAIIDEVVILACQSWRVIPEEVIVRRYDHST